MNAKLLPFVQVMQQLPGAIQDRHKIAAIAIGYACACNSTLPTSEVDDAETHYRVTVEPFAKRVISSLNEAAIVDAPLAMDFARKFWLLRYEAIHKCPRMDALPGDFFCSVFGVPKFFSPELMAFANANSASIARVYSRICEVIQDTFAQP